jgi:UDP-2-acetamido-2-deoxy-ribo-hexuluronate aminotransferase
MACFSFYISHHIQCGVGGMIVTKSAEYARVARSYMNHGRTDDGTHFRFGRIGYSSRATEMEAALGVGALNGFKTALHRRKWLANLYINQLMFMSEVNSPALLYAHSWMFMPITLRAGNRDKLLKYLGKYGIESREAMPLVNQPCYAKLYKKGSCPNAEYWTHNGLLLPLHPLMDNKQVDYVCDTIRGFFK